MLFHFLASEFYKFFSASTKRWAKMQSDIKGKTMKLLSNTRWSARSDVTSAPKKNFVELRQLLQDFTLDDNETNHTKSDSSYLKNSMNVLETAILLLYGTKSFKVFTVQAKVYSVLTCL